MVDNSNSTSVSIKNAQAGGSQTVILDKVKDHEFTFKNRVLSERRKPRMIVDDSMDWVHHHYAAQEGHM